MKRIETLRVSNKIELLYAKTFLKNLCKLYEACDTHFLELCVIELGSNLLKYSGGGSLCFLLIEGKIAIASLDFGVGIEDINLVKAKGYSSLREKSLGIGLYALSTHENYQLDILSLSDKKTVSKRGTVLLLHEKVSLKNNYLSLSMPLYDSKYNGDFCTRKNRYLFFGDVAGHGKTADITAKAAIKFFHDKRFSSFTMEQFFKNLHEYLLLNTLRSIVGCVVEVCENKWSIFGVGNIAIVENQNGKITHHVLPHGIIAESYNTLSTLEIKKEHSSSLLLMSDGINLNAAMKIINKFSSANPELLALSILHFAGTHDDKTVAILT